MEPTQSNLYEQMPRACLAYARGARTWERMGVGRGGGGGGGGAYPESYRYGWAGAE